MLFVVRVGCGIGVFCGDFLGVLLLVLEWTWFSCDLVCVDMLGLCI